MGVLAPIVESGYRALFLTITVVASTSLLGAQVMTSGSYQIQSDSVNIGGGSSDSTNYGLESTIGEVATGDSDSENFNLRAGYQQMQEVYLAMTAIGDVILSPAIGGITGGTSNGSTSFAVTTDSPAGYVVYFSAANAPAMQSGVGSIPNYAPAGAAPDFTFTTDPTEAHFGFTPEGPDIALRYQDSGGVCGVMGSDTAAACWDGVSTTLRTIVTGGTNHPNGATTTLRFRVGVGSQSGVLAGDYIATTTITALPL